MSLQDTPRGSRVHIGLFGERNSGKSSLLNALTGQQVAVVSATPGTTTDTVYKAMEIAGLGPVVFMDTAGFDDEGSLGEKRLIKTHEAKRVADAAIVLFSPEGAVSQREREWVAALQKAATPIIPVVSKKDILSDGGAAKAKEISTLWPTLPRVWRVSSLTGEGVEALRDALVAALSEDNEASITGNLCAAGDMVLLVMPQDIQAPKGRLILPQVQTLRELLDKKCLVTCSTADNYLATLKALQTPPKLIITDSQVFRMVYENKPEKSLLTSFSVLLAGFKGDIKYFLAGAEKMLCLSPTAKILIAEACTHRPLEEDIGRVKLPRMLKNHLGEQISLQVVSGQDFPQELTGYDLIIHCGACMFNRRYVLNRVGLAKAAQVPMTNYGLAIAALSGILDKVAIVGG
ncbi:MAG: [Selenomonadaceae bacterium]|nr:[FeFe] hydrogenase H-cluster maturation GTPase HydF [Selenomonadaceae bacterium]